MPPTHTWKGRERQSAKIFGARRTPLSGGNSAHTRSDSLSKILFIEHKHRKKHPILKRARAAWDEGKVLMLDARVIVLPLSKEALTKAKELLKDRWDKTTVSFDGRAGVLNLLDQTYKLAFLEDKIELVTLSEHRRHGIWAVMRNDDWVIDAILEAMV